jgi:hypothetical protein
MLRSFHRRDAEKRRRVSRTFLVGSLRKLGVSAVKALLLVHYSKSELYPTYLEFIRILSKKQYYLCIETILFFNFQYNFH